MILFRADWFSTYQIGALQDHNLQHKWILPAIIKFSNLSWILGSSAGFYKRWWGPALLDEEADGLTSHPSPDNFSLVSSLHKISEHDRLIKKQLTKYRVLNSMVLCLTRETTYSITYHIIPNTYLLPDKMPLLQNDKVPIWNTWNPQKDYKWEGPLQAVNALTEGIISQTRVDDIVCSGSKVSHCDKSARVAGQL